MTPKLTEELRQALAQQSGEFLELEDPVTNARYVLVPLKVYEQWQGTIDYDTSEPDPRDFYPAFAEAVRDELDAPGMERYDDESAAGKQP
jgi:hypothetical protein